MRSIFLLLLVCCMQCALAAVYMEMVDEQPGSPRKCFDRQDRTFHAEGSRWYKEGVCEEIMCEAGTEKGKMIIQHLGCGVVAADPPCWVVPQDSSKPYPSCCSSVECPPGSEDNHQVVLK